MKINKNQTQLIHQIADHYGESQLDQTVEELAELIVAIQKYKRYGGSEHLAKIIEEIADVEIMTAQLKHLFKCEDEVEIIKCEKLQRQIERINL